MVLFFNTKRDKDKREIGREPATKSFTLDQSKFGEGILGHDPALIPVYI